MIFVTIDNDYIEYLRGFDYRVCYNKDWGHTRPYIGVLFALREQLYFAPLTSSSKGKKLKEFPKEESVTFFPIDKCKLGGINLNNMIPLVKGVYKEVDMKINPQDDLKQREYKTLLIEQIRYLISKETYLRAKANKIYSMKTTHKLYPNYDQITCDFKKLEAVAFKYKNGNK